MIIILVKIILDQIATSIFLNQFKSSFSSTTSPIIFISITVSHSNTLQSETSNYFPPKSQTLTASPPFRQDFSSSLKTTSDHMSSAKPTKLITSPTSAGSSFDTLQSSQLNFNHHQIFHSTYICCNFFSIYSYFSILSYTHNSLLIFCSSIYILPSSRTSSSIKSTTCTSRFFFTYCATRY